MIKKTDHTIHFKDAKDLSEIGDGAVQLITTSPPYPMIEMWDKSFSKQNPDIAESLQKDTPEQSFELMHTVLEDVWKECRRVLCDGGIACINIGDATRTFDKKFRLFPNHARIIMSFLDLGFINLPNIIWRKQTNAPSKFMGSGMLPPGAYVTLEHEFILVFRKGNKREFTAKEKQNRQESAYFWEERNCWFSDLWDLKGASQVLAKNGSRNRSGSYPFEVPYRLINMFSVKEDTVLDPFLGTGTSMLAAIASGRNSVGYEIESDFDAIIRNTLMSESNLKSINNMIRKRIWNHKDFLDERSKAKGSDSVKNFNEWFEFPVITKQEKRLILQFVKSVKKSDNSRYIAEYVEEPLLDYHGRNLVLPIF